MNKQVVIDMVSLAEQLGIELNIKPFKEKTSLPRYLLSGRQIFRAEIPGAFFWLIKTDAVPGDSRNAVKELAVYREQLGAYVAYWTDGISRANRNAYMRHHIPFYAGENQVYLPFLGIILTSRFAKEERVNIESMTPAAQLVFLRLLYTQKKEFSKSELAADLSLDPVYVTRATKQLNAMGLISERRRGKYTLLGRTLDSHAFYEEGKKYLKSPVKEIFYTFRSTDTDKLPHSGLSALSEYSMLNPSDIISRALYKGDQKIGKMERIDEPEWQDPGKICCIEIWNYDPEIFSEDGKVDRLSLACAFERNTDPRIENAVDEMLEDMKWQ